MISPRAFRLIVKYLDAVDREVTKRLIRIRPWTEPALTSMLADLLDERTAGEFALPYTLDDLRRELSGESELFALSLGVETSEFPPELENRVTQSDLGLILQYRDAVRPIENWEAPFLLQAKRVAPDLRADLPYRAGSRIPYDSAQSQRIVKLNDALGAQFVKYLLYCPRPEYLDQEMRTTLSYARVKALGAGIFDYITGLEVRDDLLRDDPTLGAGIFIAEQTSAPATLMQCHSRVMTQSHPFSWFVAKAFLDDSQHPRTGQLRHDGHPCRQRRPDSLGGSADDRGDPAWVLGILRGDEHCLHRLLDSLNEDTEDASSLSDAFLPPHVMTITFSVAPQLVHNQRNSAEL